MKRIVLVIAALLVVTGLGAYAIRSADAGTPSQGPTMRYHLDEGQVLVYKATAETTSKGEGAGGDGAGRRDADVRSESESLVEIIFSFTAGTPTADGSTPITIEILDIRARITREIGHSSQTFELDAQGVKVYEDKKLVQQGKWGEIELPGNLDLSVLLAARIEAVVDKVGRIGGFDDPGPLRQLLQGANFLHMLVHQPVYPEAAITKGGSWKIERELAFANPLRLHEVIRMPGEETYTAVDSVNHLNRNCLKLHVRGNWPKVKFENGEVEADSSGTAIVDFATGVLFAYTAKTQQDLEGTVRGNNARFKIEAASTVTYIGGKQLYDQYKAKRTPQS